MYQCSNKFFLAVILSIFLLSGCATQRDTASKGNTVSVDSRSCMKNFVINGSFWSGRTVKSFQVYPTGRKSRAIPYLVKKLASIGYKINSTDNSLGLINASFAVGFGQGATTNMNIVVGSHKPKGIRVDLTFTAAGGISFSKGEAQEEFCSILEGVPS